MKINHKEDPIPLRIEEYPAMGDQLDAIFKFIDSLAGTGIPIPTETQAWINRIKEIKSQFPKD